MDERGIEFLENKAKQLFVSLRVKVSFLAFATTGTRFNFGPKKVGRGGNDEGELCDES